MAIKDAETLPRYNFIEKETVKDVVINPELSAAQQSEIRELLGEYSEIFSDVPRVTPLIEHKVELCLPCAYLVWPCLEVNPHDKA